MTRPLDPALFASPALTPVRLDGPMAAFVRLGEDDYRAASFLDARLLAEGRAVERHSWAAVRDAAPPPRPTGFIFHIGHCGSTLLSRLLGEHPALFSVREPALLRDLASGALPVGDLIALLGLCGRVWRPAQTALVKATSFVSEIAPQLMAATPGARALLLAVTPPAYLRGILGGTNSRREAQALATSRQARLERRLGRPLSTGREGETIALAWLCEAAALHALAARHPEACLALDFDRGLAEPEPWLAAALVHLGVDPGALDLRALVEGPLMRRYAKGPEHAYDPALRAAVLAEAGRAEAAEVRAGLDWLQRQAEADPWVAEVLTASATAARGPLAPPGPHG